MELVDERTGVVHDYTRRSGVVSAEVILPDGGTADRGAVWNAAEAAENRKDARTAREWVIALPAELDAGERSALAHSFGVELARRYGVAVDVAIHEPDSQGDNRNHHAHVLTTTRTAARGEGGAVVLGEKASIELSDAKRRAQGLGPAADEVKAVRSLWEGLANRALEQAGKAERIDARSLSAQGIDREPTTHLGPVASEMERRGRASDRGDGNRQVAANNAERQRLGAKVIDLQAERERRAAERRKALTAALPPAEAVKQWDAQVNDLAKQYRARADRLEDRMRGQIEAIEKQREQKRAEHAKKKPVEPSGLFAGFKRAGYQAAMGVWQATGRELMNWGFRRQQALVARIKRLDGWLSRSLSVYGPNHRAMKKAQHVMAQREPELAQRASVARVELQQQEQQRAKEASQQVARGRDVEQFEAMATKRRLNAGGWSDTGRSWRALPVPLQRMVDDFNQQPKAVQSVVLDKLRTDPKAAQELGQMLHANRSHGISR